MANGGARSEMNEGEEAVPYADVVESLGISMTPPYDAEPSPSEIYDAKEAKRVLAKATPDQKSRAREEFGIPEGMNMGGVMRDELGYMGGGMSYSKRSPVKYAKGGAVKGKNFKGSF